MITARIMSMVYSINKVCKSIEPNGFSRIEDGDSTAWD
jgi:hypothetical protein